MTAASAPEEGKKCYLKVSFQGTSRMVEWNTSFSTFKDLDAKVRKMFRLNDKLKLEYSYKTSISGISSDILMSSDEELSTALNRMDGEVLLVDLSSSKKEKRGVLQRAFRVAKAQKHRISHYVSSASARARTIQFRAAAAHLHDAAQRLRPLRARIDPPSSKMIISFFVLLAVLLVARHKIRYLNDPFHTKSDGGSFWRDDSQHVTILAAAYGGRDVTRQAQEFYNKHHVMQSSNAVFGDTNYGHTKFLHVVYQRTATNGVSEVFSQTFSESEHLVGFTFQSKECGYPVEALVNGKSIRVLGAMYDGVETTCNARYLVGYGRFNSYTNYVYARDFGVNPTGNGAFTMVYTKNNKIQMITAKEGQAIVL